MKWKVGIAFNECDKFPHTTCNPFWPHRMREKGTFVQMTVEGTFTQFHV